MKNSVKLIIIVFVMAICSVIVFADNGISLAGTTWRTGGGLRYADLIFTDNTFTGKVFLENSAKELIHYPLMARR